MTAPWPPNGYPEPTDLHRAAAVGDEDLIRSLISKGADLNGLCGNQPPVFPAIQNGHAVAVRLILDAGGSQVCIYDHLLPGDWQGGEWKGALFLALEGMDPTIVELLIQHGADVNEQNYEYGTPLFWLLRHPGSSEKDPTVQVAMAKVLIEAGASFQDPSGSDMFKALPYGWSRGFLQTPSVIAVVDGRWQLLELFLAQEDFDVEEQHMYPRQEGTLSWGSMQLLHYAVARRHVKIVHLLLQHGANPNSRALLTHDFGDEAPIYPDPKTGMQKWKAMEDSPGGQSALFYLQGDTQRVASSYACSPTPVGDLNDCHQIMKLLLDYGADVNLQTSRGDTPLFSFIEAHSQRSKSAEGPDMATIEFLLNSGADIKHTEKHGWTILHRAALSNASIEVFALLLSYGAVVDAKAQGGITPALAVLSHGDSALDALKLLLERGADVKAVTENGWTLLHQAARAGDTAVESVKQLVRDGADVNASTTDGKTPLHAAVLGKVLSLWGTYDRMWGARYDMTVEEDIQAIKMVELLIENGAEVNAVMDDGCSATDVVVKKGHENMKSLFLSDGANPSRKTWKGDEEMKRVMGWGRGKPRTGADRFMFLPTDPSGMAERRLRGPDHKY